MWIFWYFSSHHFPVLLYKHRLIFLSIMSPNLSLHQVSFLSFFYAFSIMHVNYTLQKKSVKFNGSGLYQLHPSFHCRSVALGVRIWAISSRMEERGHLLHLPPLCCSPNVWICSSLQLDTLWQMDNISNKPPPASPLGSGTASFTLNVLKQHKWTCLHTV